MSGRAFYTRVNPLDENVNDAFPQSDTIKALDMTWTHYVNSQIPLKLNGWVSGSDHLHKDVGAALEVEFLLVLKALKF